MVFHCFSVVTLFFSGNPTSVRLTISGIMTVALVFGNTDKVPFSLNFLLSFFGSPSLHALRMLNVLCMS